MRRLSAVLYILILLPLFSIHAEQKAVITGDVVNVRGVPTLNADVITGLPRGTGVTILKKDDHQTTIAGKTNYWYKIRTAKGITGWVFGAYLRFGGGKSKLAFDRQVGPIHQGISGLAVSDTGILYASHGNALSRSDNGGTIWNTIQPTVLGQKPARIEQIQARGSNTVVLATADGEGAGLWVSENGGSTWRRITQKDGLPFNDIYSVAIVSTKPLSLVATGDEKIAFTSDGGSTWQSFSGDYPDEEVKGAVMCPSTKGPLLWIAFEEAAAYALVDNSAHLQLAKTEDMELSLGLACDEDGLLWAGSEDGVNKISPSGASFIPGTNVLTIAAIQGAVVVATRNGVSYSTEDGGWTSLHDDKQSQNILVQGMAWDARSGYLYIASEDQLIRYRLE